MEHKTALITGASRGIGRAIALEFAAGGYDIAITASKSLEHAAPFLLMPPATGQ